MRRIRIIVFIRCISIAIKRLYESYPVHTMHLTLPFLHPIEHSLIILCIPLCLIRSYDAYYDRIMQRTLLVISIRLRISVRILCS